MSFCAASFVLLDHFKQYSVYDLLQDSHYNMILGRLTLNSARKLSLCHCEMFGYPQDYDNCKLTYVAASVEQNRKRQ